MINCIIVDDDPVAVGLVKHFVTNTEGLNLLTTLTNGLEAANYIRNNRSSIDLIFLDVEMPEMGGMELLESFKDLPPVVLMSSKEKYAAKAFGFNVIYYLVKPLEYSKFLKAIELVFRALEVKKPQTTDYLFIKENGVLTRLSYDSISYFEALGDYVKVHVKGTDYIVNSTMKNIEEKLSTNQTFTRIHRSFIINLNYLDKLDAETAIVANKTVPIGNKYRSELLTQITVL